MENAFVEDACVQIVHGCVVFLDDGFLEEVFVECVCGGWTMYPGLFEFKSREEMVS